MDSEQAVEDLTARIETAPSDREISRILHTHDQNTADYVRLMMEEEMDLPTGEDRAALLITEV